MATPLSVVIRAPLANTIAACVGGKDAQSKVNSPLLMWRNTCGPLIDNDVDIYLNVVVFDITVACFSVVLFTVIVINIG